MGARWKWRNTKEVISALLNTIEWIDVATERCKERLLRHSEVSEFFKAVERTLTDLLPDKDSDAYRIFERDILSSIHWGSDDEDQYASASDAQVFESYRDAVMLVAASVDESSVRGLLGSSGEFLRPEYHLSSGDRYHAMRIVLKIMQCARKELIIVDNYLDDTMLDYIEALAARVSIRLLTKRAKKLFVDLLREFVQTRPNLEARMTGEFHDRYIVIDGASVWHIGPSIKDIGKKAGRISRVLDVEESLRITADIEDCWAKGEDVLLAS